MRMTTDSRIKIAVQKSGRLTEHSLDLLVRCGLSYSRGKDQLICYGENMPVDVLLVRDDDIPRLVQEDICDLGIVGLNIIEERRLEILQQGETELFTEIGRLDFGQCRLSFGLPAGVPYEGPKMLQGKRIATTYPRILADYLKRNGVEAQIVAFSGAVEIAPSLGKADLICDLVSSGSTLRAHQLYEAATILESRAALIQTPKKLTGEKAEWLQRLLLRIKGVLEVKGAKYIMLHAPRSALKAITALLPGSESPTIIPLEGRDDKVAVHAVCRENVFWETLEELKKAGASSMLVLPVEKMLS
jgi:ATP phosphoribosyltransferase